jgi:hypothetical protein
MNDSESNIMPMRPPIFRPPGWTPAPSKRREAHERFYGTQAWKRIRAEVLKRDGYRCTASDCSTPSAVGWLSITWSSVATVARTKFRICARCARAVTTVGTPGGGGGSKSLRVLGGATGRGARSHFRKIPQTFFVLGGGGWGGGGVKKRIEANVHF